MRLGIHSSIKTRKDGEEPGVKEKSICLHLSFCGRSNGTENAFDPEQATPFEIKDFMDLSQIPLLAPNPAKDREKNLKKALRAS